MELPQHEGAALLISTQAAQKSNPVDHAPAAEPVCAPLIFFSDRRIHILVLSLILLVGIFLRLPSSIFEKDGAFSGIGRLHPQPGFRITGYDERLYQKYVEEMIRGGISSYPDLAEGYVELQRRLPAAILPPTRFVYLFSAYLWHHLFGSEALASLHNVSSLFSILLLLLSALFALRLGGWRVGLCVTALMSVAPTQIHMGQHALIDGVFAFSATLCLWLLWENLQRPNKWPWLISYTLALAWLVLTKENAMFAYIALLVLLAMNYWLRFGQITRTLLLLTLVGPLLGVAILVNLCGSLQTAIATFQLLVSKASVLPFAIATGDGPWYRYLVDLMLMSPVILILAIGRIFTLKTDDKAIALPFSFRCWELSAHGQRPLRNESPLRKHVGPPAAISRRRLPNEHKRLVR